MAGKKEKTAELTDMKVLMISIVGKGANRKKVVWKSADIDSNNLHKIERVVVIKYDEEKNICYGIVYPVNEIDTDDEWASPKEVEKAMHWFMKQSNMNAVDTNHSLEIAEGCYIVESWLVKEGDAIFPEDIGAWAVGILVENEEIKKGVKDGTYTGLSLYGFAQAKDGSLPPVEKKKKSEKKAKGDPTENGDDNSFIKAVKDFYNMCKSYIEGKEDFSEVKKAFDESLAYYSMTAILEALHDAFWNVMWEQHNDLDGQKAELTRLFDEAKEAVMSVEMAKEAKEDDEDAIENLKKGIEAIQNLKTNLEKIKEGDFKMDKEEVKGMIEEAVKPLKEKNQELEEKNGELEKSNTELQEKLDKLSKSTKGSAQDDEIPEADNGKPKVKSKIFGWTGMPTFVKSEKPGKKKEEAE